MKIIKKMLVALIISITTFVMVPVIMPINELNYAVEAASLKASQKVYITPSGERYHLKSTCGGKNSRATTLSKAETKKLTPCKKCVKTSAASVKISKTKYTMTKGDKYTLKVSGTKKETKWSSSNKKVATVDSKGKVTAKKKGTATITAKVGSEKYKCKITVETPSISKTKYTMTKEDKYTLKISGTKQTIKWSSSNKKIATVDSKGKVSAKKKGTATITAKVGSKKYKCKITVESPSINKTKVNINQGKTYTLKVNGTNRKITWSSSDKKIATVNSKGKVTAKKKGTATITAKVGSKKLKCKVTVKYVKQVKANYMYIDYEETNVKVGETIKLKVKASPSNYTNEVKWKSSNEKVATVKNGIVTGVSSGKAKITATLDGLSYSVDVYVLGNITLTLQNSLPEKFSYKPSNRVVTTVEISDIKIDYTPEFYTQEYSIKMTLSGTKTYQYYSNIDSIAVGYKILDEDGNVYDTGNFWKSGLSVGDRFNNVSTPLDLPPGNYILVLSDY